MFVQVQGVANWLDVELTDPTLPNSEFSQEMNLPATTYETTRNTL